MNLNMCGGLCLYPNCLFHNLAVGMVHCNLLHVNSLPAKHPSIGISVEFMSTPMPYGAAKREYFMIITPFHIRAAAAKYFKRTYTEPYVRGLTNT